MRNSPPPPRRKTTTTPKDLDETTDFAFEDVAAGAYTLGHPRADGGREANGGDADDLFDPLGGDVVALDVTPSTATVYGFVVDEDGFAVDSATVTANAESTLTDEHGRFIIEGIKSETRKIGSTTHQRHDLRGDRLGRQASGRPA